MVLTLELNETQETLLRRRAAEAGQEPADYLLTAAGIASNLDGEAEETDDGETTSKTGSAYDLFEGLPGGWRSGGSRLSEETGAAFAEGMAEKRRQGHL